MVVLLEYDTDKIVENLRETMTEIGIRKDSATSKLSHDLGWVTQDYILTHDVIPIIEGGPQPERGHSARVAEYGVVLSDILRFGKQERILKFLADISHDRGKLKFKDCYAKLDSDPTALCKIKAGHISPENLPLEYGPIVASAIEQHHRHQRIISPPYPATLRLPQSPESVLLSQLIAIPDFWDALTARPSKKTGAIRSYAESADLLMQEYADMKIRYDGSLFPGINTTGKVIVENFLQAFDRL
jgi:hypothetical protein